MLRFPSPTWLFLILGFCSLDMTSNWLYAADGARKNDPVLRSWTDLRGVAECSECHDVGPTQGTLLTDKKDFLSRRTELAEWTAKDKHAIARQRVEPLDQAALDQRKAKLKTTYGMSDSAVDGWVGPSNLLSYEICRRLGLDVRDNDDYQLFAENCLSCHGGFQPKNAAAFHRPGTPGKKQPGISCVYCHQEGPSGSWVKEHDSISTWRFMPPREKSRRGMRDLTTVANRVELCTSCHVGDLSTNAEGVAQNKFITHAMYAAGHPPLPSFELVTFETQMPKHWEGIREFANRHTRNRDRDKVKNYFLANFPKLVEQAPAFRIMKTHWSARELAIGAVGTNKAVAKLVEEVCQTDLWGDFALFDCRACHHALRVPSIRQQARLEMRASKPHHVLRPGRPQPWTWPNVLLAAVAQQDVDKNWDVPDVGYTRAFTDRPFGDANACQKNANRLIAEWTQFESRLASKPFNETEAKRLFGSLGQSPPHHLFDYHTARQLKWALRALKEEFNDHKVTELPPIDEKLKTILRSGKIEFQLPTGRTYISGDYLNKELQRQAEFNPLPNSLTPD